MRVHRFCRCNKLVPRRTIHTAQNHVYNDDVIADWVSYVRQEILIYRYSPAIFVSTDEQTWTSILWLQGQLMLEAWGVVSGAPSFWQLQQAGRS